MTQWQFLNGVKLNSFPGLVIFVIVVLVIIIAIFKLREINKVRLLWGVFDMYFNKNRPNKYRESNKRFSSLAKNVKTVTELSPYVNNNLDKILDHQVETNLADLPDNYYGYINAYYDKILVEIDKTLELIANSANFKEINYFKRIQKNHVRVYNRYQKSFFEFFKINQEYFLCFYLNEHIYHSIENKSDKDKLQITCSSVYQNNFTIPCYIEFSKILFISNRDTPQGIITDMYIKANIIKIKIN